MAHITLDQQDPTQLDVSALVVFHTKEALTEVNLPEGLKDDYKANPKEVTVAYNFAPYKAKRVILTGLGEEKKLKLHTFRLAVHEAVHKARDLKVKELVIAAPTLHGYSVANVAAAIASTVLLSDYNFDRHITKEDAKPHHLTQVTILTSSSEEVKAAVAEAIAVAEAVVYTRNVANERGDDSNPQYFEDMARKLAAENGLKLTVVGFEELKSMGAGLICGVGQGATVPPRMVILEYNGGAPNEPYVALVGKGVTFDTGGLNLKGTGFIETMYLDKHGASSVLGAMKSISSLKLKVNLVAALACAENAIDAHSYKPSSVLKSLKGLTVEIGNTDAEGRLVLADTMTYVQRHWKVGTLVDVATLTGAIVIALGEFCAGLFSNDDALASNLLHAGEETHERVWRMPLWDEYADEMKGRESDLRNIGKGRSGGACTAAGFLRFFVEEGVKWAHIDIAGSGMASEPRGYVCKNGTGFGVQLLTEFIKSKPQH